MTRAGMSEYHSGLIARHHVSKIIRKQQLRSRRRRSITSLSPRRSCSSLFTAHALDLAGTEPIKSRAAVWVAFTLSIFRFCVIGTSGFGQTKWNTHSERSSATNRCNCAIWRSLCNRHRCVRMSRSGVLTCDCVLVWAIRCGWQFPRKPEGNCRARDFLGRKIDEKRV